MAKLFRSSLPKVISKANKDISTIIENDIATESEILKNLVDQVLAANLEVKKKNNQRITETKRKLQELDIEIDDLNKSIDLVDRETVIEQLNQMIDAENKIFQARQEIRFFENNLVPERLESINIIYNHLATSIETTNDVEVNYKSVLKENNNLLFDKQISVTNDIINLMETLYTEKRQYALSNIDSFRELMDRINHIEQQFLDFIHENINEYSLLSEQSGSEFTDVDDDLYLGEKIEDEHIKTLENINIKLESLQEKYSEKHDSIVNQYKDFEASVRDKYEAQNKKALEDEKNLIEQKDEELRNVRLLIIDAEKKQNFKKVQSLLRKFDKIERSKISKVMDKTDKLFITDTKKSREKAIKQLETLQIKLTSDTNKQNHQLALEQIKYKEAQILYKIKMDYNALQTDTDINKKRLRNLSDYLTEQERVIKEVYKLKTELRVSELEVMQRNEIEDNSLLEEFKSLLLSLKQIEHKRLLVLQENEGNHEQIKIEQQFFVNKTTLDLKLNKELSDIDKRILKKRNESLIRIEKLKEDATSEIIYQESLIKIAKKERELQLVKVNSLYENERSLAEEQVERINLGVQVNDAFVKTTLENQLLFASQQIKCSESEFDIRVESVSLTKDQELTYAHKKIDYYTQKYEYEKSKIIKERDDKLEDLNYKLLLFTEQKENNEIKAQIDALNNRYQILIDEVDVLEHADDEISQYERVIEAAELRAQQAVNEALALKEQTVTAFQTLYDQTKEKYDLINKTNRTEETVGIMPLLNNGAISSADERLQKAIKEAETLYNDRIIKPEKLIKETKETLLNLTQDDETEKFCNDQKQLKKHNIEEHKINAEALMSDKDDAIKQLTRVVKISEESLIAQRDSMFDLPIYRNNDIINTDYVQLIQKEKNYALSKIEEFVQFKQSRLSEQKVIQKEITTWIKQTLNPYKRYIRYASRGLNAEKRELARKNKRLLKREINIAMDQFTIPF